MTFVPSTIDSPSLTELYAEGQRYFMGQGKLHNALARLVADLKKFHEQLIGLGYASAFPGARKRLRSTRDGVRIDVIASGEYPGDGKPKPVRFPNPLEASVE